MNDQKKICCFVCDEPFAVFPICISCQSKVSTDELHKTVAVAILKDNLCEELREMNSACRQAMEREERQREKSK